MRNLVARPIRRHKHMLGVLGSLAWFVVFVSHFYGRRIFFSSLLARFFCGGFQFSSAVCLHCVMNELRESEAIKKKIFFNLFFFLLRLQITEIKKSAQKWKLLIVAALRSALASGGRASHDPSDNLMQSYQRALSCRCRVREPYSTYKTEYISWEWPTKKVEKKNKQQQREWIPMKNESLCLWGERDWSWSLGDVLAGFVLLWNRAAVVVIVIDVVAVVYHRQASIDSTTTSFNVTQKCLKCKANTPYFFLLLTEAMQQLRWYCVGLLGVLWRMAFAYWIRRWCMEEIEASEECTRRRWQARDKKAKISEREKIYIQS